MSVAMLPALMKGAFSAMQGMGPMIQAALGVGTAVAGHLTAAGQASAMEQANAEANDRTRKGMIEDYDQIGRMTLQERAAATQKQNQSQMDSKKTAAQVQVAAGEGGVSGLSVDALLGDVFGQEASIRDSVNQNLEGTINQLGHESRGIRRQGLNQMGSRPIPDRPSILGTSLQAGSSVFGAYKDRFKVNK